MLASRRPSIRDYGEMAPGAPEKVGASLQLQATLPQSPQLRCTLDCRRAWAGEKRDGNDPHHTGTGPFVPAASLQRESKSTGLVQLVPSHWTAWLGGTFLPPERGYPACPGPASSGILLPPGPASTPPRSLCRQLPTVHRRVPFPKSPPRHLHSWPLCAPTWTTPAAEFNACLWVWEGRLYAC